MSGHCRNCGGTICVCQVKTYTLPDANFDYVSVLKENTTLRAQIAKLTAPPTDAEIEAVARIIHAIEWTCYFDETEEAITKWLEMRS